METYNNCFYNDLDPDRCGIFKIGFWQREILEVKCKECEYFIFINWKALPLSRSSKRSLYKRLRACSLVV